MLENEKQMALEDGPRRQEEMEVLLSSDGWVIGWDPHGEFEEISRKLGRREFGAASRYCG